MYEVESRLLKLSGLFTIVGILIAALGLYGLVSFILEKRTKEISIRKVVGASLSNILKLIGKHIIGLILIGFVFGGLFAYYLTDLWLEDFTYRINVPWEAFGLSLGLILIMVLITISHQSIKVALTNPVKFLRQE